MTREVAYESLLYADRRQLHRHIGASIEAQRAGRLSEYWEVLAYHFDLAGEWEKALDYHLKAANKAQEVYANEDAMYHFRQALEAAEQLSGSEQQQLEAHEGLGEVLTLVGRYDEALEHLKEAQGLAAGRVLAALHRKTAEAYEAKGDYQSAFDWLEQGLALPEIEETVEEAGLYRTGAGVFYRQGDNEQAREWCKRSLEVAERLDDEKSLAQGNHLLGAILIKSGELTEAVRVCKQSLSAYQELGELLGQFHAHNNLASAYYSQDSWGLAADHHRAAMGIVSQIGYTEGQAQIASNLGEIYLKQGELEKAKERYQAALAIVKELGIPFGEAILHNNLGAAYARGKNWRKASNHLEQSQALFEQIGSEEVMVEVLRHRAEVERGRGQLAQALTHAERSLDYAHAHHMPVEEGTTLRVLGSIRRVRHELDQAEEALTQALALAQKANKRYETALTRLEIARLRLQQDRREEGSELAQQAAQIFADLGAQLDLKEAERVLMHAKSG
jgi:tetratricopeptide (TPR) repeat protein